jgi:hypothetical protein
MAGSLISWEAAQVPGAGNLVAKVLSDEKSRETVNDILSGAKAEVEKMLAANGTIVEALRDALLDREELVGEEITAVIEMALGSGVELPEAFIVD